MTNNKQFEIVSRKEMFVIGLPLRTDNSSEGIKKMEEHWIRFFDDGAPIPDLIPNKKNNDVLAIYTKYAGDYTNTFTLILGFEVATLATAPERLVAFTIPAQTYALFSFPCPETEDLVRAWKAIWASNLKRAYKADFELRRAPKNEDDTPDMQIYIGVRE